VNDRSSVSRRRFLGAASAAGIGALAGCAATGFPDPNSNGGSDSGAPPATPRPTPDAPADVTTTVMAAPGTVNPGPGASASNWLYDGESPGAELRVTEGDVVEAEVTNDLPEGTTVHWHGLPVANPMDGVPNVTQDPIPPGESFTYKF